MTADALRGALAAVDRERVVDLNVRRRYVDLAWGQMHVAEVGDQEVFPVLLLHQTPRSWDELAEVLPLLGRTRRAIAVDLPGMGRSDPHPDGASIEAYRKSSVVVRADDPSLTATAGMVCVTETVRVLGLVDAIDALVGPINADIQRPDELNPGEWVVVYQFVDTASLEAWMSSPERTALLHDGNELVEPGAREQVVAVNAVNAGEPVTAVSSVRVKPDCVAAHRALHEQIVEDLATAEGFVRCELFELMEGVQDDTIVFISFDGRHNLDRWLASDRRR